MTLDEVIAGIVTVIGFWALWWNANWEDNNR